MSYRPPPKTAYGDQDFIKEDSVQPNSSFAPQIGGGAFQPSASLYYQPDSPSQLPVSQQGTTPGSLSDQNQNPLISAAQSMTQEDILFMKSWRQDTFFYKVVPLAIASNAANFYYNHTKGLPQKPLRFFLLTGASYFLGVWLSRSDLKLRVAASTSNTPFMLALKRLSGVSGQYSEFQEPSNSTDGWGNTNDGFSSRSLAYSSSQSLSVPAPNNQPIYPQYNSARENNYLGVTEKPIGSSSDTQPNGQLSSDFLPKPASSYEELRARNRGVPPPKQM